MKLNVKERLLLLGILPKESSFVTLKIVRKLQDNLSFNEEELKEIEFVQKDTQITWNPAKDIEKEIEIGEKATDIIIESLKELDKNKKITADNFELYEKFIKD